MHVNAPAHQAWCTRAPRSIRSSQASRVLCAHTWGLTYTQTHRPTDTYSCVRRRVTVPWDSHVLCGTQQNLVAPASQHQRTAAATRVWPRVSMAVSSSSSSSSLRLNVCVCLCAAGSRGGFEINLCMVYRCYYVWWWLCRRGGCCVVYLPLYYILPKQENNRTLEYFSHASNNKLKLQLK